MPIAVAVIGMSTVRPAAAASSPTSGLRQYTETYSVQHPYDLPQSDRFSVTSGRQYNAWIQKGDKPFKQGSPTGPRTEMRWHTNWNETWGRWFRLNADFNPATGALRVWINGALVLTTHYSAPASKVWYFKDITFWQK